MYCNKIPEAKSLVLSGLLIPSSHHAHLISISSHHRRHADGCVGVWMCMLCLLPMNFQDCFYANDGGKKENIQLHFLFIGILYSALLRPLLRSLHSTYLHTYPPRTICCFFFRVGKEIAIARDRVSRQR